MVRKNRFLRPATRRDAPFPATGAPWPWRGLVLAALATSLAVLVWKIHAPLTDMHSFRQTQTALTAFWLPEHWDILRYETPVMGAPWAIPFEFPLYQLLASLVSQTGIPLAVAGRLLSWLAMAATLVPMRGVLRRLFGDDRCFYFCAPLFLLSPIILFWGRTFMIETLAVFLLAMFVWHALRALERPCGFDVAAATVYATLGLLTKITTGPPFYLVAGLLIVRQFRRAGWAKTWKTALALGGAMLAALLITLVWVRFSDQVKADNLLGEALSSANLRRWNFGTLDQRLDPARWQHLLGRAGTDILGQWYWLLVVPILALFAPPAQRRAGLWAYALFFVPILLFFNLHVVHNYYQTANALFLLLAGGIALAGLAARGWRIPAGIGLGVLLGGMLLTFFNGAYAASLRQPPLRAVHVGTYVREHTPPRSAAIILGNDWNSDMAYYAQRKSLCVPDMLLARLTSVADITDLLGGLPLSAVVLCPPPGNPTPPWSAVGEDAVRHIANPVSTVVDGCTIVTGQAAPQP